MDCSAIHSQWSHCAAHQALKASLPTTIALLALPLQPRKETIRCCLKVIESYFGINHFRISKIFINFSHWHGYAKALNHFSLDFLVLLRLDTRNASLFRESRVFVEMRSGYSRFGKGLFCQGSFYK